MAMALVVVYAVLIPGLFESDLHYPGQFLPPLIVLLLL
jgi:hypothetical protein